MDQDYKFAGLLSLVIAAVLVFVVTKGVACYTDTNAKRIECLKAGTAPHECVRTIN